MTADHPPARGRAAPRPAVTAEDNLKGLTILAGAFLLLGSTDATAKLLSGQFHPLQVVWFRQAGLTVAAMLLLARYGPALLKTAFPARQVIRGSVAILSSVAFVTAITYAPLADAIAVTFIAPFVVTILGAIFLGERVPAARWVAVAIGFLGAVVVVRPGFGVFHPAIFLAMVAAALFAVRQVMSRPLAADRTATTLCYTGITSFVIVSLPLPWVWTTPPDLATWGLIALLGGLAALGETTLIRAFEIGEATVLAPMHYSIIIWATMYGWLLFGDLPDGWTVVGAALICATGFYLVGRERAAARRLRRSLSPAGRG